MGYTSGGGRVDAVALLARRVLRTRERTVATYVAVVHVEIEHGEEHGPEGVEHDDRQLCLALERPAIIPPRVRCAPLPELAAPSVPDAAAITSAAMEAVARAERSVLPTVRPGRHVVEVVESVREVA